MPSEPLFHQFHGGNFFVKSVPPPDSIGLGYRFFPDPISNVPGLIGFIESEIFPFASKLMGSFVSVENVQLYETFCSGELINEQWHFDGDLKSSFKIIIYLSDVGVDDGPLELKLNGVHHICTARFGQAIAFAASRYQHRGARPKRMSRWALNLKVYPSLFRNQIEKFGSRYLDANRRRFLCFSMDSMPARHSSLKQANHRQ
jgi:hypothetical protein